jgi:hypothetical protein
VSAFHGILLTRDDEDIIDECIGHALTYCDRLYVFETGGCDRTWEIVEAWSKRNSRISAFQNKGGQALMESGLRGYVFERFRHNVTEGDWIVQVDSDEFYEQSPREFVRTKVRRWETAVYNSTYEFRLLQSEAKNWDAGREGMRDRKRPIQHRRRYFNLLSHSEPRMFRYRRSMQWPPWIAYPYNVGFVARARIPIRHYPQRDPIQLQKRWALRNALAAKADPNWKHWQHPSWRELLASDNEDSLLYWKPGTPLPSDKSTHHLARLPKRVVQFFVHIGLMHVLDHFRPKFPLGFEPIQLPPDVVARIRAAYAEIESAVLADAMTTNLNSDGQ